MKMMCDPFKDVDVVFSAKPIKNGRVHGYLKSAPKVEVVPGGFSIKTDYILGDWSAYLYKVKKI